MPGAHNHLDIEILCAKAERLVCKPAGIWAESSFLRIYCLVEQRDWKRRSYILTNQVNILNNLWTQNCRRWCSLRWLRNNPNRKYKFTEQGVFHEAPLRTPKCMMKPVIYPFQLSTAFGKAASLSQPLISYRLSAFDLLPFEFFSLFFLQSTSTDTGSNVKNCLRKETF